MKISKTLIGLLALILMSMGFNAYAQETATEPCTIIEVMGDPVTPALTGRCLASGGDGGSTVHEVTDIDNANDIINKNLTDVRNRNSNEAISSATSVNELMANVNGGDTEVNIGGHTLTLGQSTNIALSNLVGDVSAEVNDSGNSSLDNNIENITETVNNVVNRNRNINANMQSLRAIEEKEGYSACLLGEWGLCLQWYNHDEEWASWKLDEMRLEAELKKDYASVARLDEVIRQIGLFIQKSPDSEQGQAGAKALISMLDTLNHADETYLKGKENNAYYKREDVQAFQVRKLEARLKAEENAFNAQQVAMYFSSSVQTAIPQCAETVRELMTQLALLNAKGQGLSQEAAVLSAQIVNAEKSTDPENCGANDEILISEIQPGEGAADDCFVFFPYEGRTPEQTNLFRRCGVETLATHAALEVVNDKGQKGSTFMPRNFGA